MFVETLLFGCNLFHSVMPCKSFREFHKWLIDKCATRSDVLCFCSRRIPNVFSAISERKLCMIMCLLIIVQKKKSITLN